MEDGLMTIWYENGQKKSEINYKDGVEEWEKKLQVWKVK